MIRVVIVDDEALVRTGFTMILNTADDIRVVGTASGVEALDVIKAEKPDVLLLDIRMPQVDGITLLGLLETMDAPPAVAMLTRSMRSDLGVMISASHNAYEDNGIKLFGPDGYKLSDEVESEITRLIDSDLGKQLSASPALGRAKRIESADADALAAKTAESNNAP